MNKLNFSYAYRRVPGGMLFTGSMFAPNFLVVVNTIQQITPDSLEIIYVIQLPS